MLDLIEEWYRQYGLDVFNYLVYRMGTKDVDDLVQETFIKALRGFRQFDNRSSPKTWLISIAKNVANDFYRKNRKRIISKPLSDELVVEQPIDRLLDSIDAKQVINQALHQLRPAYIEVVIMRGVLELPISDTAQALGWSESKVKVTWHRALKALRESLRNEETGHV